MCSSMCISEKGVLRRQDLTARARDSLVSFGERLSTRLFAALLNSQACLLSAPFAPCAPRAVHSRDYDRRLTADPMAGRV